MLHFIETNLHRIKVSDNFTLEEACHSDYAGKHRVPNIPDLPTIMALAVTARAILQPIRMKYGIAMPKGTALTSGFRCLQLNQALGGKESSQHVKGEAYDFKVPGLSNYTLARWIKLNLSFDQLILEKHGDGTELNKGWIHCSYVSPDVNRNQVLTYDGNSYTEGLHLYD